MSTLSGMLTRISDTLWRKPNLLILLLILPPALWLGIIYLGPLKRQGKRQGKIED